jgi:uncharacterized membrane protein YfcA
MNNILQHLFGSILQLLIAALLLWLGRYAVFRPRQVAAFYMRKESGRAKRRLLEATKREGYFFSLKVAGCAFLLFGAGMFIWGIFTLIHLKE